MGADFNRRCNRIDERTQRARHMINRWHNGNHMYVYMAVKSNARLLAAVVHVGMAGDAADIEAVKEIVEAVHRERNT